MVDDGIDSIDDFVDQGLGRSISIARSGAGERVQVECIESVLLIARLLVELYRPSRKAVEELSQNAIVLWETRIFRVQVGTRRI